MAEYAVIDRTESLVESIFSDLVTFSFLAFCIWLGMGSKWWTLVTGIMFLIFAFGKIATVLKIKAKKFTTKKELNDWADILDWQDSANTKDQKGSTVPACSATSLWTLKAEIIEMIRSTDLDDGQELCLESQDLIIGWIDVFIENKIFDEGLE